MYIQRLNTNSVQMSSHARSAWAYKFNGSNSGEIIHSNLQRDGKDLENLLKSSVELDVNCDQIVIRLIGDISTLSSSGVFSSLQQLLHPAPSSIENILANSMPLNVRLDGDSSGELFSSLSVMLTLLGLLLSLVLVSVVLSKVLNTALRDCERLGDLVVSSIKSGVEDVIVTSILGDSDTGKCCGLRLPVEPDELEAPEHEPSSIFRKLLGEDSRQGDDMAES
uniref:Uncharacterized protein n=1 Tax=Glossina austeni TaxID=7395 RepID=A0A1A9VUX8_GLOAU